MCKILDAVEIPEDIKALTINDLVHLSAEIRSFSINSVSKTGGHLFSSLGVVDMNLALH